MRRSTFEQNPLTSQPRVAFKFALTSPHSLYQNRGRADIPSILNLPITNLPPFVVLPMFSTPQIDHNLAHSMIAKAVSSRQRSGRSRTADSHKRQSGICCSKMTSLASRRKRRYEVVVPMLIEHRGSIISRSLHNFNAPPRHCGRT